MASDENAPDAKGLEVPAGVNSLITRVDPLLSKNSGNARARRAPDSSETIAQ